MKQMIRVIWRSMRNLYRLNITKTLYFNFRCLPLKQALKLPIFIYGKVYLWNLSGKVRIETEITKGMIRIGYKWIDLWPSSFLPTQIQVLGKLTFNGAAIISGGTNINVQSKEGELSIGENVVIGGGTVCKCLCSIKIGTETRITGNCTIMDCNMHFIKNIDKGTVANYKAPIVIGKKCWINAGSIVSKGAFIPDYSISARGSYLSKDYSEFGSNLFLVGSPAKPSSSKVQRIFTVEKQTEFTNYFETHQTDVLQLEPGLEMEEGHREGF